MKKIDIYTTPICGYCKRAKSLLKSKNLRFNEIDLFDEPKRRKEMIDRANGRMTVPQIFIGGVHIGGSDELHALDRRGKLDQLLKE